MLVVCGLVMVYLRSSVSHHLGFAKRGELGRAKEGAEEGGEVGGGETYFLPLSPPSPFCLTPTAFAVVLHSPQACNVFLIQDGGL